MSRIFDKRFVSLTALVTGGLLPSCQPQASAPTPPPRLVEQPPPPPPAASVAVAPAPKTAAAPSVNPLKNPYFGELHLHTAYSLDAYIFGTHANDPFTAYRFAKGEEVELPAGGKKRIKAPLDFAARDRSRGSARRIRAVYE